MPRSAASRIIRFNEFEVDVSSGELRRKGVKVKFQGQPFQVLLMLLERPGEVITREELRNQLWPADTFVDFEHGLNSAIRRLRDALSDSADTPVFIETLPRRGYRFLVPVTENGNKPDAGISPAPQTAELPISSRIKTSRRELTIAIIVTILGCAVLMLIRLTRSGPLPKVLESRALTNDGLPKFSLTTDGARLYFIRKVAGKPVLSEMSVQGGDVAPISIPFEDPVVYDISPDRSALLVGGNVREKAREVWIVPIPAGAPHRVGNLLATGASWGPDGMHIAYVRGRELYITNVGGSEQRSLGTMSGYLSTPRYSLDGKKIRFSMYDATTTNSISIWEIGVDGKQLRRVALDGSERTGTSSRCCGVWSVNGSYFFYSTYLINQRMGQDLWVSTDSSGFFTTAPTTEKLTSGPLGFDSIIPSSDGRKLFAIGTQARAELVRHDAHSNTFEPFLGGISATDVEISRDGQWAAYVSYPDLTLWRSRVDGSERMQLTFSPTEAFKPRWSPDGRQIAFTDLGPSSRARVFLVPRDGGLPAPMLAKDQENEIDPSWAPDGKSMVFARTHLDPELAIFAANIATGELHMVPSSKDLTGPTLSPDGRFLAALSRDWMALMLYDTRTQQWQELRRTDSRAIGYCNWSLDSNWLYCRFGHVVARTRIADRRTEQIVDLSSIPELNPSWIGLAQDNSVLLDRDQSVRDIYALTLSSPK